MEVLDVQKLNMFVYSQIAKNEYKYEGDTFQYKLFRSERRNVEVESALLDYFFYCPIDVDFYWDTVLLSLSSLGVGADSAPCGGVLNNTVSAPQLVLYSRFCHKQSSKYNILVL